MASPTKHIPQPRPICTQLLVSDDSELWDPQVSNQFAYYHTRVKNLHIDEDQVLLEVTFSGLSAVDRDPSYAFVDEFSDLLVLPAVEVLGRVRKFGARVEGFHLGQTVAGFNPGQKGLSNFVVLHFTMVTPIATMDPRYLNALSPMVTSSVIFRKHLRALSPSSNILINVASSGIGLAISREAQSRGHRPYGIVYCEKGTDACAPFCVSTARVRNLQSNASKERVRALSQAKYNLLIMPAILSDDTDGIYPFLLSLLEPYNSKVLLLCSRKSVNDAVRIFPHEVMEQFGIVLQWFMIDGQASEYREVIKSNVEVLKQDGTASLLDTECVRTLDGIIRGRVYEASFRGKFRGQKYVQMA